MKNTEPNNTWSPRAKLWLSALLAMAGISLAALGARWAISSKIAKEVQAGQTQIERLEKGRTKRSAELSAQQQIELAARLEDAKELIQKKEKLAFLHQPMGPVQSGDWLALGPEPGQTFAEYIQRNPADPEIRQRVIGMVSLGDFSEAQSKVIEETAAFLEIYFGLPVKAMEPISLDAIPAKARRAGPEGGEQISTRYVIDEILNKRKPADAQLFIGLSAADLWPGEPGWNFVFGQASPSDQTGVWSIHRYGDPAESPEAFQLCLLRALKLATHESGHMFGIKHCVAYQCNMNGSGSLRELDRHPLWLCPECAAKIWRAVGDDPAERCERLAAFCERRGLPAEKEFYEKSARALKTD